MRPNPLFEVRANLRCEVVVQRLCKVRLPQLIDRSGFVIEPVCGFDHY